MAVSVPGTPSKSIQVARNTLIVISGTALSFGVGLLRRRIIAAQFGTALEFDAYTAVDGLSELLVTTLATGTLVYAFMPLFVELLDSDDRTAANLLASHVFNLLAIVAVAVAVLTTIIAPVLVGSSWGLGPGYPPATQALMVNLLRILLISMVLFTISTFITGILHSHQHFWLPALAPTGYSIGVIIGAWLLAPLMGIIGLAWGAVLGALIHLVVQLPAIWRTGFQWTATLTLDSPNLRKVVFLMLPRIADLLMARAALTWLAANLNSYLGEGRQSAMTYAYSVMNIPWTLIGTAIGFSVFPIFSELAIRKDPAALREGLSGSIRAVLVLVIPSAIGLIVLGRPLIELLFESGQFSSESTHLVFFALQFYSLTLISQSLLDVVVRAYAATKDTITPLVVSIFTTAINVALALWLTRPFAFGGIEQGGPPLANGIAVLIEVLAGLLILSIRWKGIDARAIVLYTGRSIAAAVIMGITVVGIQTVLKVSPLVTLMICGPIAIATYTIVAILLGVKEIVTIPRGILQSVFRPRHEIPTN